METKPNNGAGPSKGVCGSAKKRLQRGKHRFRVVLAEAGPIRFPGNREALQVGGNPGGGGVENPVKFPFIHFLVLFV